MKLNKKDPGYPGAAVADQWMMEHVTPFNHFKLREIMNAQKQVDAEFIRQRYEDDPVVLALLDAYLAAIKR